MARCNELPAEVLLDIFLWTRAHCIVAQNPRQLSSTLDFQEGEWASACNRTDWIAVSHVSSFWRAVALASPLLWTLVDCGHPRWVPIFVARSKQAPLVVRAIFDRHVVPGQDLAALFPQAHRVKELHLVGPKQILQYFQPLLAAPAPLLERAFLVQKPVYPERLVLPDGYLFGNTASRLKVCIIHGPSAHIWSPSPWTSSLTDLDVTISDPTRPRVVLDAFRNMPLLERVSIRVLYPREMSSPGDAVALRHLRELRLTGHPSFLATVLSSLTYPHTSTLRIRCSQRNLELEKLLAKHWADIASSTEPMRGLRLLWNDTALSVQGYYPPDYDHRGAPHWYANKLHLEPLRGSFEPTMGMHLPPAVDPRLPRWDEGDGLRQGEDPPRPAFEYHVDDLFGSSSAKSALSVCGRLPLEQVRMLSMRGDPGDAERADLLRRLHGLRTLYTYAQNADTGMFTSLMEGMHAADGEVGADLRKVVIMLMRADVTKPGAPEPRALQSWLETRHQCDRPIEELCVLEGVVDHDTVMRWRPFVGNVSLHKRVKLRTHSDEDH
jgi:hypothetical protein